MPPAPPPRDPATGRWQDPSINPRPLMGLFPTDLKQKQRRFLGAYLLSGTITDAARVAGLAWSNHYHWLEQCEAYLKAFEKAKQIICEKAGDALHMRGVTGYNKPVIYKGQITGSYKEYSDTCLIAYLKANDPAKYRESLVNFTSNAPASITIITNGSAEKPTQPAVEGPDGADGPFEAIPTRSTG